MIKEADKGSAVVIWDKKDYLMEAEKKLSSKETYEEVYGTPLFSLKLVSAIFYQFLIFFTK